MRVQEGMGVQEGMEVGEAREDTKEKDQDRKEDITKGQSKKIMILNQKKLKKIRRKQKNRRIKVIRV